MKTYTWKEAIYKVMAENGGEMTANEISDAILLAKLKKPTPTPAATVGANIYVSIKKLGNKSPFKQVSKAKFGLIPENIPQNKKNDRDLTSTEVVESVNQESIIKAFGMFWDRNGVNWDSSQIKLLGEPSSFSGKHDNSNLAKVNFADESGIYILYDHRTIVYVGRAIEGTLGRRLKEHTRDRLNTRWNRFSWFGTIAIKEDGKLAKESLSDTFSMDKIISTLEAILIESLEPLQNRRRGDELDNEFTQVIDDSKKREAINTLLER